jgi:hypothetical protein
MLHRTTISGTAAIMKLSWNEAAGTQKRAVERGAARRQVHAVGVVGTN